MKQQDLKQMYDEIHTTGEIDREVLAVFGAAKRKTGRMNKTMMRFAGAAAAVVVCIGVLQIPVVHAAVGQLLEKVSYSLSWGGEKEVDLSMEKKELSEDIPTESFQCDTLAEMGERLGIDFLTTPEEYHQTPNRFLYEPYVSDSGSVYGGYVNCEEYALGDLKDVKRNEEDETTLEYRAGDKYETPIMAQMAFITDEADEKNEEIHFPSVVGAESEDWSNSEYFKEAKDYHIRNINTDAIIAAMDEDYVPEKIAESSCYTLALFTYQGVEYCYMGGVSPDVMKEFLETLR